MYFYTIERMRALAENSIDVVRAAEAEAEEAARAAQREAARLVDEAHTEAVRLANTGEDDAHKKAADDVAAAHTASQKALEKEAANLTGDMEALATKARANQPAAIEQILKALV